MFGALLPRSQAAGASAYLHNMMRFQSGVFYQGSLCPALKVTKSELPILIVAPGIHCTWTSMYDGITDDTVISLWQQRQHTAASTV